jgi:ssRNA-specific RNase YbeY (16S rRNA maturation enzyme)
MHEVKDRIGEIKAENTKIELEKMITDYHTSVKKVKKNGEPSGKKEATETIKEV